MDFHLLVILSCLLVAGTAHEKRSSAGPTNNVLDAFYAKWTCNEKDELLNEYEMTSLIFKETLKIFINMTEGNKLSDCYTNDVTSSTSNGPQVMYLYTSRNHMCNNTQHILTTFNTSDTQSSSNSVSCLLHDPTRITSTAFVATAVCANIYDKIDLSPAITSVTCLGDEGEAGGPTFLIVAGDHVLAESFDNIEKAKAKLMAVTTRSRLIAEVDSSGNLKRDPQEVGGQNQGGGSAAGFNKYWDDWNDINRMMDVAQRFLDGNKARCPAGWTNLATGCYKLTNVGTHRQATDDCKKDGGYLVEIDTWEENNALSPYYKNVNAWLGATDIEKEGEWVWSHSGRKVSFTNWQGREPTGRTRENCLQFTNYQVGSWNDAACGEKTKGVCELDTEI